MAADGYAVLLLEDDARTRDHLAAAIAGHPALRLQAAVGTVAEALAALTASPPAVLLTDLQLPDGDGTDVIRACREHAPRAIALVITVFGDEGHVVRALEAGALGYLLKDGEAPEVAQSILDALDGGSPISPPIARHLLRRFRPPEPAAPAVEADALPRLSAREHEVLTLIVKGFSYAEIARLTGTSPHTVTTHVRSIYRKLAVHSRGEAVYEALQLGLVKLAE